MNTDKLAYYGGDTAIPKGTIHPGWPKITKRSKRVVLEQMDKSISIYNRSGIFEEFEDRFANLHGSKYALLNNSGTNSIWAMFVGANLMPGDEIICPTYTFFATNTPLLSSGLIPVFCDADHSGNIDPADIKRKITPKTKAIIVTHMWGYPCQMDEIVNIAKKNKLLLFEDCSHAHFATYDNKIVGSFGDAAAWSLQGQKNLTGGEGGIVLTNNREIYIRANLLGHYNKRCKQEIPETHDLYEFSETGMGLKMRAHPLATVFANEQLDHIEEHKKMRAHCADSYEKLLSRYDFVEVLSHENSRPSWYAFVFKYQKPSWSKVDRHTLVEMLVAEGLLEADIPGSTKPNHELPLFQRPYVLFPQFYSSDIKFNVDEEFTGAKNFSDSIVKLPTWAYDEHNEILGYYLIGLRKVLDYVSATRNN